MVVVLCRTSLNPNRHEGDLCKSVLIRLLRRLRLLFSRAGLRCSRKGKWKCYNVVDLLETEDAEPAS